MTTGEKMTQHSDKIVRARQYRKRVTPQRQKNAESRSVWLHGKSFASMRHVAPFRSAALLQAVAK